MPLSSPAASAPRWSSSAVSLGLSAYRRCRCCLQLFPTSELFPYSYLQPHAFPSLFHHQHAICIQCARYLHSPGWDRQDYTVPPADPAGCADDDGHELHCRLCGQGHESIDAFMCDFPGCRFIFCPTCIRVNGGEPMLRVVEREERWLCFDHPTSSSRLLPDVDLECRAERGQLWHLNAFDCFNLLQLRPIPSFTYLTPRAQRRFSIPSPFPSLSPSPALTSSPQRLLSTCMYRHTSGHPAQHVKYLHGLMLNLLRFPIDWPQWTLRLYYDNSLIIPAPPPHEDRDHSSPSSPSSYTTSSTQYSRDLALAWSRLLHALDGCPWFQPVYYNWPYLQDASSHHHGHVGMMVRFLALAELGVTASHVAVVDLDNVWTARGRAQAEGFERGKAFHRYVDVDYSFPLMGGGFNARVERVDTTDPNASPFADIESQLHAFLTEHHRQPEAVREMHGRRIDESWGGTRYIREMERRSRLQQQQQPTNKRTRGGLRRQPQQERGQQTKKGDEEEEGMESDGDEAEGIEEAEVEAVGLVKEGGRLCSRRIAASLARQKREEEQRKEQQRRAAEHPEEEEEVEGEEAAATAEVCPLVDCPPPPFFTYALDQVFLLERIYPRMSSSLATTYIRLEHIDPSCRAEHRIEEATATSASPLHILERRLLHQRYGRRCGRFADFYGMIEQSEFPRPTEVLAWMMERIERVREVWKGKGQGGGEWQRARVEWLYDRASPGHFHEAKGKARARKEWEGLLGPPSATSPRDFRERWKRHSHAEATAPRPAQRALSYSTAHPTLSTKPAAATHQRKQPPPVPEIAVANARTTATTAAAATTDAPSIAQRPLPHRVGQPVAVVAVVGDDERMYREGGGRKRRREEG